MLLAVWMLGCTKIYRVQNQLHGDSVTKEGLDISTSMIDQDNLSHVIPQNNLFLSWGFAFRRLSIHFSAIIFSQKEKSYEYFTNFRVGYLDGLNENAEKKRYWQYSYFPMATTSTFCDFYTHTKKELLLVDFVSEYWWMG